MKGMAVGKGCGSILNSYATGRGISFAIGLQLTAEVELFKGSDIEVNIRNEAQIDDAFARVCVKNSFEHFGIKDLGAKLVINGDLPPARGLKSSSAVGNAVILAVAHALGVDIDNDTVVSLNTSSAIEASVTTAGSYDDTCASLYGGAVMTDYNEKKIVARVALEEELMVLIHSRPRPEIEHITVDRGLFRPFASLFDLMFNRACEGHIYEAMIVNGLVHADLLGFDRNMVYDALNAGALSASLSGKGPAFIALVKKDHIEDVAGAWKRYPGELITTTVDNTGSMVLSP